MDFPKSVGKPNTPLQVIDSHIKRHDKLLKLLACALRKVDDAFNQKNQKELNHYISQQQRLEKELEEVEALLLSYVGIVTGNPQVSGELPVPIPKETCTRGFLT